MHITIENMLVAKMVMLLMCVHMLKQDSESSAYKKNLTFCSSFGKTDLCVINCTAEW